MELTSTLLCTHVTLVHPPPYLQPALPTLEPISSLITKRLPPSHPAISATSSPVTCLSSPGTKLNYPTNTHATYSSTTSPATCSSSPDTKLNHPAHTHDTCSSTSSPATRSSSFQIILNYPTHTHATC
jgi:hypothetical protein